MSLALLRGHKPPSEEQLVESVEGIMGTHGLKTAAFFGHSFGSISVAWMARRKPHVSFFFFKVKRPSNEGTLTFPRQRRDPVR